VVCAEGGASLAKMPGGNAWKAKYDAKYPGQFQVYSPYTYDATFVLVDAMKRANSTDPKVYTAKLDRCQLQGCHNHDFLRAQWRTEEPCHHLVRVQGWQEGCLELISSVSRLKKKPPNGGFFSFSCWSIFRDDGAADRPWCIPFG
jgi:hypothetical protein